MARRTPFSIGRRWLCERPDSGRPSFHFIVIGPGATPREKRCRVEWDPENPMVQKQLRFKPIEQNYTHAHIKKCAKLVEES